MAAVLRFPSPRQPCAATLPLQTRTKDQDQDHVCWPGRGSAGGQPAQGDLVSAGGGAPGVRGVREPEETLQGPPADQPGSPGRPDWPGAAAVGGGQAGAPSWTTAGETTL